MLDNAKSPFLGGRRGRVAANSKLQDRGDREGVEVVGSADGGRDACMNRPSETRQCKCQDRRSCAGGRARHSHQFREEWSSCCNTQCTLILCNSNRPFHVQLGFINAKWERERLLEKSSKDGRCHATGDGETMRNVGTHDDGGTWTSTLASWFVCSASTTPLHAAARRLITPSRPLSDSAGAPSAPWPASPPGVRCCCVIKRSNSALVSPSVCSRGERYSNVSLSP